MHSRISSHCSKGFKKSLGQLQYFFRTASSKIPSRISSQKTVNFFKNRTITTWLIKVWSCLQKNLHMPIIKICPSLSLALSSICSYQQIYLSLSQSLPPNLTADNFRFYDTRLHSFLTRVTYLGCSWRMTSLSFLILLGKIPSSFTYLG